MQKSNNETAHNKVSLLQLFPLFEQALSEAQCHSVSVSGICEDSREIVAADLFVARDGEHFKGSDYIETAAKRGAVAALIKGVEGCVDSSSYSIPVIALENLEFEIGHIAAKVFNNCVAKLNIIGITGTNGKTSCAHFLAQALNSLDVNTFIIGTIGNGRPSALQEAGRTTPNACELHRLLARFYKQGAQAVVMEVSSHALEQGRVQGVPFNVAAYTNLSRDHLDYHGTMQAYAKEKSRLFTDFNVQHRVLNINDEYNRQLFDQLKEEYRSSIITYSENQELAADYTAINLSLQAGLSFTLAKASKNIELSTSLIGKFNVANLLLCAAVLHRLGFTDTQTLNSMKQLATVPGRMQNIVCTQLKEQPLVVVDYAHTPDALQKAIEACRVHCKGQLHVVFGCGGDRDTGKRAEMAQIAHAFADCIVVTSDNPRTESPQSIIEMIVTGFVKDTKFRVNADRKEAIGLAINSASVEDVVLIAGKGHEDYQEIMGVKHHFLDAQVAMQLLEKSADVMSMNKKAAQTGGEL